MDLREQIEGVINQARRLDGRPPAATRPAHLWKVTNDARAQERIKTSSSRMSREFAQAAHAAEVEQHEGLLANSRVIESNLECFATAGGEGARLPRSEKGKPLYAAAVPGIARVLSQRREHEEREARAREELTLRLERRARARSMVTDFWAAFDRTWGCQ